MEIVFFTVILAFFLSSISEFYFYLFYLFLGEGEGGASPPIIVSNIGEICICFPRQNSISVLKKFFFQNIFRISPSLPLHSFFVGCVMDKMRLIPDLVVRDDDISKRKENSMSALLEERGGEGFILCSEALWIL